MILEFGRNFSSFYFAGLGGIDWEGRAFRNADYYLFFLIFFLQVDKPKKTCHTYLHNCATNPCYFKLFHKSNKLVVAFCSPLDEACLSKFETIEDNAICFFSKQIILKYYNQSIPRFFFLYLFLR